jgi:RNA polymerase sigma-70 factor (ECF subfamily)
VSQDFSAAADLERARAGDSAAFTRLAEPLRRQLHAHCYAMLGSVHDADDAVQDALLRAWQGIGRFEGRSSLRTWLYAVTTHACLDVAKARGKRALPMDLGPATPRAVLDAPVLTDVAWLGPYPDAHLGTQTASPLAAYELREAVELAFVAALQHLPGNQRAALLLFEVLGFTVGEIASIMDTSPGSVNSALARARKTLADKVPSPSQQQTLRQIGDSKLTSLVSAFSDALERGDPDAFVALLTADVTWSMPPVSQWYQGIDAVMDFAVRVPMTLCPSFRHLPVSANAQPAAAFYVAADPGLVHDAWSITVLTLRGERIAHITSFLGAEHFAHFGLPSVL